MISGTSAIAGLSLMVTLLSFESTGVFTVVGHRLDHAVYCKLETPCFKKVKLCIGVYED
jgi:hypothetical protein